MEANKRTKTPPPTEAKGVCNACEVQKAGQKDLQARKAARDALQTCV